MARREDRLRFWALIAAGLSGEAAAIGAGVSPPVGTRWIRESHAVRARRARCTMGRAIAYRVAHRARSHASTRPGSLGLRRYLCRAPDQVSMVAALSERSTSRLPAISQHKPA
jgi:hypothetical protein